MLSVSETGSDNSRIPARDYVLEGKGFSVAAKALNQKGPREPLTTGKGDRNKRLHIHGWVGPGQRRGEQPGSDSMMGSQKVRKSVKGSKA